MIVDDAAITLAGELGPVLPLNPRTRVPLTKFACATTDRAQIEAWWRYEWPGAGLGLVAGSAHLIAIDVEHPRKGGADGFASLRIARDEIGELPLTRTHRTKSGGRHYLYRIRKSTRLRSAVGKLRGLNDAPLPGVDVVAGDHAVLRWPPTPGYTLEHDHPIAMLPDLWVAALTDRPAPRPSSPVVVSEGRERRYALAALEREAIVVAELAAGRNVALSLAAFKCGQLCPPLDAGEIEDVLRRACELNGALREHGQRRCLSTIWRGVRAGMSKPRALERSVRR